MTTISYPSTVRNWATRKPLNHYTTDYHNDGGVRISLPLYLDVPNSDRKRLLNAVREVCATQAITTPENQHGGIKVVASQSMQPEVEAYLGISLDVLRTVLFARGGLNADLLFRLQEVTGIVLVTEKDISAAFTARKKQIKTYIEENKFHEPEA